MKSQISYYTDGTTQVFHANWHNEPMFVVFTKTPKSGTRITIITEEADGN